MKYKKGDKVQVLEDLTQEYIVDQVYKGKTSLTYCEMEKVVLNNDKVYSSHELTFYSEPIAVLARQIKRNSTPSLPRMQWTTTEVVVLCAGVFVFMVLIGLLIYK